MFRRTEWKAYDLFYLPDDPDRDENGETIRERVAFEAPPEIGNLVAMGLLYDRDWIPGSVEWWVEERSEGETR